MTELQQTVAISVLIAVVACLAVGNLIRQVMGYLERRRNWNALSNDAQEIILELELLLKQEASR